MASRWLNLFFRYSGYTYSLKQKIVTADGWLKATPYAVILIISELGFAAVSLPMYLVVKPSAIQEEGVVFPRKQKVTPQLQTYTVRRKISLSTFWGAGTIFVLKLLFIGAVSFYLLGVQELLADTQDWTFDTPGDYTYDGSKIEVTGGVARLKDIGTTTTGSTTNPFFTSNATGWTESDWDKGAGEVNPSGTRQNSGGNPGGYIQINIPSGNSDEVGGYYYQSFITTVANPTATLNFDWTITAFDTTPTTPITYIVYAFVDTGTGVPVIGQEVWNSGEITSTSGWVGTGNIDVAAKVAAAGTYYLKLAVWIETGGSNIGPYTVGFDNAQLNWSKTTVAYSTVKPTTTPVTSLTMSKTMSWDSFTETATKNGGEIYYQLSSNNGTTWKFWNGSAWATSTLATDYNIASDVNTRISSFTTTTNQIKWRAFLSSSGSQQVILDNIAIGYTPNTPPQVQSLAPAQNTQYGYVYAGYNLVDGQNDPSSLVTYEYSLNGTFSDAVTMTASTTDPSHNGVSNLTASPSGIAHTFVWDARSQLGSVYNAAVYVRLRANDGIGSGNYTTSSAFAVDFVSSTVSNVSSTQTLGTTTVQITYDLFDNTSDNITVELQISGDGGSTWTVPSTSISGDVGSAVASGNGKTIYWQAGTDYASQQKSNMQVRIRAKDKFQNQGAYVASGNFSLDTLPPATLATVDLQAQPNAGDTNILIGGSFTEANPNTNGFMAAIGAGAYGATTTGDTNTATPANQSTAVGATLNGHDYISKVKVVHTDDYGNSGSNENLTPSTALKYVKPYTPSAPTLSNPVTTRLDLQIVPNAGEASDVQYAIFETSTNKFVQSDGTLGTSAVWQVMGTGSGQWGNGLSVSGQVRVTGLSSPVANYVFKIKSRNPSDTAHAASSESTYSAAAQIPNTAPAISLNTYSQTTDGTKYVPIAYTGTDGQGDIVSLSGFQYSIDGVTWNTMTEKSGVGSSGTANLIFVGSAFTFAWNSGLDLPNVETSTAKIRLKGNDTLADGSLTTSNNFTIDNKAPAVTGLSATQNAGARTVAISYTLTDANNSAVAIDISSDGGSTWNVATTTLSGAIGSTVTPGGKTVSWNGATDFNNQYNTTMQLRARIVDAYGNQGSNAYSAYFTIDTHAPVLANLTAAQDSGALTFTYHYDVTEDAGTSVVVLSVSADSGSTWTVATTTAAGDKGAGITNGTGKTITWNAGTDYNNQEKSTMQFRLTASDSFGNAGVLASSDFNLDTLAPRITNVRATQPLAGTSVTITYDLADQNNSTIYLDISSNNGSSWAVATTTLSGELGAGRTAGTGKTVTWNAKTDFNNQQLSSMLVRVRGQDIFSSLSGNTASSAFDLDTLPPAALTLTDLKAQPLAGAITTFIGGSFTEANPNVNDFYVAINGGAYGAYTAGAGNTASPADLYVPVGATLNGSDYITNVKIIHTDDYGQNYNNENSTPSVSYKYVKPYTPAAPTVYNPAVGAVTVGINKNAAEVDGLEYAIYEITSGKYIQSNGVLGTNPVWQLVGTGAVNQWGFYLSSSGQIRVTGLANPSYTYQFQVKSRNWRDSGNAASSESALSSSASSANQSPTITINSVSQSTDGSKYVTINYTGTDLESDTNSLATYQYSTDNSTWSTMTEKSGVGSEGLTGLAFTNSGQAHNFMWDVGANLNNTEDGTVYVRLKANDGTSDGNITASSAFTVDTKAPVVATVAASQDSGSNNVSLTYNLTDLSNSTVQINISSSSGSTWNVATSTASGDVGSNIGQGTGKAISWNPGSDFSGQELSTMRAQIGARDNFGNQGSYVSSADFSIDTKSPVFANVVAAQVVSSSNVRITYDVSDANNATVAMDISADGGSTWNVASSSVTGNIGSVAPGTGKEIIWDAGADYPNHQVSNMQVRLRAVDSHNNATGNVASNLFALNTQAPTITSVSASQTVGSNNVIITYDLFDANNVNVSIEISNDSGSTWTVSTSSASGDIGPNIVPGLAKSITWNAGTDYNNQQNSSMKARIRGTNTYGNIGTNSSLLGAFALDTLAPATLTAADLQSQPNAGDTTALVGGSFTETNPISNLFAAAINGGTYTATTTGQANTAAPASLATAVGTTLTGADYISKVKIVETDNYGHSRTNENTTPNASYKYVKPYAPNAPTVNNPQNTTVDVTINAHAGESSAVEYAIYEISTGNYAQSDGTLGATAIWKTLGTGAGQWGQVSNVIGGITVTGLSSPVANYSFKVKSRNPSDTAHAASSESDFSSIVGITNSAPAIAINSAAQQASGGYVLVNYTGTDTQNDTSNLNAYEYSTNNISWQTMTEKIGVGSSGTSSLTFASTGTAYVFAWDIAADLPNSENLTVYVRLRSTDGLTNSNLAQSSAFYADTRGPVISNINVSQATGSSVVTINYDLSDSAGSNNTISIDLSSDGGSTWTVAKTTLSGDVGTGVTAGTSRSVTWNAGVDFANSENSTMQARIRGTDSYGNVGSYLASSNFSADTRGSVVSSVSASQNPGSTDVTVNYTLSDLTPAGNLVEFLVSADDGSTWAVATSTRSGNIGTGQTTGSKTFTWNAGTDYSGHGVSTMRVEVRAKDYFNNQGAYSQSANFSLDTLAPTISNITASQNSGSDILIFHYDLNEAAQTNLDISSDGGASWNVAKTTITGDINSAVAAGASKTVTWNAATDFNGQENSTMRYRIRGIDSFGNTSSYFESGNFSVDTGVPLGLTSLSKFSETATTVTLDWQSVTDAHFNHFELWHGANESDVTNRTSTANIWTVANDANLTNSLTISTVITGLSVSADYYVKIFAVDDYGNALTVAALNIYTPPVVTPVTPTTAVSTAVGAVAIPQPVTPPGKPILTPLATPSRITRVVISGLAEPRSRVDLYDNGNFVARFNSVADVGGRFSQAFNLSVGTHILTVRAVNFSDLSSQPSDPITVNIVTTAPPAPIILSPRNNDSVTTANPVLIGVAESLATVQITLDNLAPITVTADAFGAWRFGVPSDLSLANGTHAFAVRQIDEAGNASLITRLVITKTIATASVPGQPIGGIVTAGQPTAGAPAPIAQPIPPAQLISEVTQAVELAGIPVPTVGTANARPVVTGDIMSFSGTSIPNTDVVVYIHSDQALIYRARTDSNGLWTINHSQATTELTPGDHTIYAVAVDSQANVKSRPSAVSSFTVERNFWVMLFQTLNLQTTAVTLFVLLLTILWLYRIRKLREAA